MLRGRIALLSGCRGSKLPLGLLGLGGVEAYPEPMIMVTIEFTTRLRYIL